MHQAEERGPSDTERFNLCRNLSFFKEFPENELWEVLRISKWRKFQPNTALIKEGDQGDSFFILAGGYVRVTRRQADPERPHRRRLLRGNVLPRAQGCRRSAPPR